MSHFMSPCLLACALGLATAGSLAAATATERDQQALAVKQLVMKGMRIPAQRQIDEFTAAGYPDEGGWVAKVLREAYLLRFLAELTPVAVGPQPSGQKAGATIDPKLQKEVDALTKELDAATKAGTLPAIAKLVRGGGGNSIERLVNELSRFIHPDRPKPIVEPGPEKRQAATNLAEVLRKAMDEEFKKDFAKVKEHKDLEKPIWDLDDKSPEYKRLVSESVALRIEALESVYLAILGLREVSLRGQEFGIPEAQTATQAFLKAFFTDHRETFNQWEFEWGEFNPFIREFANVLLSEAVRLGVKDAKEEDVEAGLQAVIDFDVKSIRNSGELIEAYRLKISAWCNLLRFRLEMATPREYTRGIKDWNEFTDRAKSDPQLRLGSSPKLQIELGQLYILAARLFHAKDDSSQANALLGEIIAQKPANALAGNAREWLNYFSPPGATGAWSAAPIASDPGMAVNLARAFIIEANATIDAQRQRSQYLNAAVALRNAVLGLNGAPDKVLIEFGPTVYDLYAMALAKLNMKQHAAIVSVEGAGLFASYIDTLAQNKKPNPWFKPGTKEWDDSITNPRKLGQDALYYANSLAGVDKGLERIIEDASRAFKTISPSDFGPAQERNDIIVTLNQGDFESALGKAKDYEQKYPNDALTAFQLIVRIRQAWIDKLVKDGGSAETIKRIQDDAAAENKRVLELLDAEQGRNPPPTPERQKLIDSARNAIRVDQAAGLVSTKHYSEAMDLVTSILKAPPGDEGLVARLLRLQCKAASEYNKEASAGDKAKDMQALQANWKRYAEIYRNMQKFLPKLRNKNVDGEIRPASQYLAGVFYGVVNQIIAAERSGPVPPAVSADIEEANRAFADLYEPWINESTAPANILFCANKLWEVDAKERAANLYLKYQATLASDSELEAFQKDPKPILDKYGEAILIRAEFKKYWDEIDDLSWDSDAFKEAWNKRLAQAEMPPGVHADYFKALAKIAEFRSKILVGQKLVMAPEQYKAIETSLEGLTRLLNALANKQIVSRHLAQYYREIGQYDKALPLLTKLYEFDTHDPDAVIAIIDATRRKMLAGQATKEEIANARQLAAQVREDYPSTNKLGRWEAEILVMEFSLGLGDTKTVNDTLGFMHRNRTDLSRDLVAPRVEGDDKRIRRALNVQAIELAQRFLKLYGMNGVNEKVTYRVDEVDAGVKTIGIYTDVDAPKFIARSIKDKDDEDVLVIVAENAPETPAAGTPAATAPIPVKTAPAPAPAK
jgi:hypothetical protein